MGTSVDAEMPFCFMAIVEKDGLTASASSGFDIVKNIADHPRGGQINRPVGRRLL
jgi:hypothetical protein